MFAIVPSKYSSNFTIDPNTGVLRNNGELDREALDRELKGRIELNITATDKGTPPLFSVAKVIINVEVRLITNYWCCDAIDAASPDVSF